MNGLILINKPEGLSSRAVVNKVNKVLQQKKIGHTGTLDPLATGVLVLCVGKATKISSLLMDFSKTYRAEVLLGIETDTLDLTGQVVKTKAIPNITKTDIERVLASFIGEIEQEVPLYSAVKVKGKKLYKYARQGESVLLPKKKVIIKSLNLVGEPLVEASKLSFKIECVVGKGTYIRSLIRDIGYKLGTVATMVSLVRLQQGPYHVNACFTLNDVENNNYQLITLQQALSHLPQIKVEPKLVFPIKNGAVLERFFKEEEVVLLDEMANVLALYKVDSNDKRKARPAIMLFNGESL